MLSKYLPVSILTVPNSRILAKGFDGFYGADYPFMTEIVIGFD